MSGPAARPVRHQPRAAVPRRRLPGAARARGRRLRPDRRRRPPRRRRRGAGDATSCRSPSLRPSQRGVLRLAASGPLPRGGRRDLAAASRCRRRGSARAAPRVPFVLWATIWAHPRTAGARALLPAAARASTATPTPSPPTARTSPPTCAPRARRGPVFEAPQSVDDAFWAAPAEPERHAPFQALFAGRLSREKGVCVLLRAWHTRRPVSTANRAGSGWRRPDPSPGRRRRRGAPRRAPASPSACATSTRAATLWWCRRSPRATSWSRGGSSSTKPSTRESP